MLRITYTLPQLRLSLLFVCTLLFLVNCRSDEELQVKIRYPVDSVGFAYQDWQLDSILVRIARTQDQMITEANARAKISPETSWKVAISPHDDYTYAGYLYPSVLDPIRAKTIIFFGVAHSAKKLGLENKIIFDAYDFWQGPYGSVKVSPLRQKIISQLSPDLYEINDQMQKIEHSVEALIPFLQKNNKNIEIVSILVPYMSFKRMQQIAIPLAKAVNKSVNENDWTWGRDYAFVISTDAVHYGDKEWGGKNFARFGTDDTGYKKAIDLEYEIINNCLVGPVDSNKIRRFTQYTVQRNDFREYKWAWCGRYSVPMGLLMSFELMHLQKIGLEGRLVGYANSIDHPHIKVDDLGLGTTANAHQRHWVGYAAIGYE